MLDDSAGGVVSCTDSLRDALACDDLGQESSDKCVSGTVGVDKLGLLNKGGRVEGDLASYCNNGGVGALSKDDHSGTGTAGLGRAGHLGRTQIGCRIQRWWGSNMVSRVRNLVHSGVLEIVATGGLYSDMGRLTCNVETARCSLPKGSTSRPHILSKAFDLQTQAKTHGDLPFMSTMKENTPRKTPKY